MPVHLQDDLAEVVRAEAAAFGARAQNPAARDALRQLEEAAASGHIPEDLLPVLGQVLEVSLASGRIRARYGAREEQALGEVFRRTPRGRALEAQVAEVNAALSTLAGETLAAIRLAAAGPGSYRLLIEAGGRRLSVALGPSGAAVQSMEIAL